MVYNQKKKQILKGKIIMQDSKLFYVVYQILNMNDESFIGSVFIIFEEKNDAIDYICRTQKQRRKMNDILEIYENDHQRLIYNYGNPKMKSVTMYIAEKRLKMNDACDYAWVQFQTKERIDDGSVTTTQKFVSHGLCIAENIEDFIDPGHPERNVTRKDIRTTDFQHIRDSNFHDDYYIHNHVSFIRTGSFKETVHTYYSRSRIIRAHEICTVHM
nr:MAG TPA: hypothetical protein [Caudoviricetes sp.]